MAVMSRRMVKTCGELGDTIGGALVLALPGGAIPDLEVVAGAQYGDVAVESGVPDQGAGDHHAPGGVELGVRRRAGEGPPELPVLARERGGALRRAPVPALG